MTANDLSQTWTTLLGGLGVVIAFTFASVQPQPEEAREARRTAGVHLAPTGSDFSISDQTEAAAGLVDPPALAGRVAEGCARALAR